MIVKSFKKKVILPTAIILVILTSVLAIYISTAFLSHSHAFIDGMSAGNNAEEVKAAAKAAASDLIRDIIIIGVFGLLISIICLYRVVLSVSAPLIILSERMEDIEEGYLNVVIDTEGEDEIAYASKSLQKLVNTMRKLIDGINNTIVENKEGKAYNFDVDFFNGAYKLLAERIAELSDLSMKDKLTKLSNRRSFDFRLDLEWARSMRDKTPLSFLIVDIDRFKEFNDMHGHQQGDLALQMVADILEQSIKRGVDFIGRWGGEEFVVLLPNTNLDGAMQIAEGIREKIENTKKVTVSIGVNTQIPEPEDKKESFFSSADKVLYYAKRTGRNKVCNYQESMKCEIFA